MTYIRYIPLPPLNRYIEHLYYLDGQMPFPQEHILPVPLLDLKINLGGAFRMYDEERAGCQTLTESWLVGLYGVSHRIEWPSDLCLYGVRFKPGGAYPLAGLPMSELYNQVVPLESLWGCFASEIRERLAAAATIEAGFALFERLLLARLCEESADQAVVEYGIDQISRHCGALSIKSLSDHIGISQNHLGTQFKRVVGASTKELARLYRFEHVLHSINPVRPVDWTTIAHQCGYYDQSHFNKDFATFTGYNPTGYLQLRRRVFTEGALVDQLSLRILPTD
ncbi:AraC family transcriptional regulator [Phototrophicus methaneseepsis]|uniref:AraC family transcriptional regulator n=1 Tax=Phototrophicus methaneseepsis TaxID=2710758 RepID=A0A7S8ID64_9CHLR|nr:helix-turn-helix domain-containing protein [Phototrophicus methaneseepsis]QPC82245.1 AraC family transcriptional regulator [Phototrophicus methaneseepsis]